jgi:hypothetical protein
MRSSCGDQVEKMWRKQGILPLDFHQENIRKEVKAIIGGKIGVWDCRKGLASA